MKYSIAVFLILISLFVSSCVHSPMASPKMDAQAKLFHTVSDKAGLYIYRNEIFGALIKMPIYIDQQLIGNTTADTYVFRVLEPGEHLVTSQGGSTLQLQVEAGKNYFVWQEVKMGVSPHTELHLVNEIEGKQSVMQCQLIAPIE
jgi:hypothetical protein